MNTKKILLWVWIFLVFILWWWKFWHFVVQDVPLGYDPGMYRAMMQWYIDLLPHIDFTDLDAWIQKWFPPFGGILYAIRYELTHISLDWLVTYGVAFQSLLISAGIYFFVSPKNKAIALIAAWLSRISFVQYEVFWWNYIKQLRWMFFLLMVLGLFVRKRYRVTLPIIAALAVTHRPALLSIGVIAGIRCVSECITTLWKKESHLVSKVWPLIWVWVLWWVIALPMYREFIQSQIPHLFRAFGNSIDTPTIRDTFKSGGTFMTTIDFLRTNRVILWLSVLWFVRSFWSPGWKWYQIGYVFGAVRVFGQLAFYQRMMWYADLFFIVFAGHTLREITRQWKWWWIVWVSAFALHGWIYSYRVERTWRPIMEDDEYAFMQTLPEVLPIDAIVMNTHSGYSTRLKGWSDRTTLSPGLFWDDRRNRTERQEKMREASWPEICQHVKDSYWDMTDKLYIWQGSKQIQVDLASGPCMSVFAESEEGTWTMYVVDLK